MKIPGQSPFAPVSYREPSPEKIPDHPPMMRRLIDLGITQAEREEVRDSWAEMSDAEKRQTMEAYEHLDDDELRRQIAEARSAEGEVQQGAVELVDGTEADADSVDPEDVPDGPVPVVLAWVGDDPRRAAAALLVEQRRHDPPRKTLVDPLSAYVG